MSGPKPTSTSQSTVLGWLMPPLFLSAVGLALWLVFNASGNYFAWGAGLIIALTLLWVLVSTIFPRGPAERICPACGADTLVRAEASTTSGLVCKSCLWRDDEVSSFLLAEEEEDPIETTVLQRRRKQARKVVIRPWAGPTESATSAEPPTPPDPSSNPS